MTTRAELEGIAAAVVELTPREDASGRRSSVAVWVAYAERLSREVDKQQPCKKSSQNRATKMGSFRGSWVDVEGCESARMVLVSLVGVTQSSHKVGIEEELSITSNGGELYHFVDIEDWTPFSQKE